MNKRVVVVGLVGALVLIAGYLFLYVSIHSGPSTLVRLEAGGPEIVAHPNGSVTHYGGLSMSGLAGSDDRFVLADARLRYVDASGRTIGVTHIGTVSLNRPGTPGGFWVNTTLPERPAAVYLEGKWVEASGEFTVYGYDFRANESILLNRSQYVYGTAEA